MRVTAFHLSCGFAFTFIIAGFIAGHFFGLRWNKTASFPRGIYQVTAFNSAEIPRGSLVMACPEQTEMQREARDRGYLPWGFGCSGGFAPLFKKVMAMPGDSVDVTPIDIKINGAPVVNSGRLEADGSGRAMPPLPTSGEVPSGMVWLLSDYAPRSWDSRYFGPVPMHTIEGFARPIWTFD